MPLLNSPRMPCGISPCCCRRSLTLLKLAKHIQSTLVTAIVAGLSAACEDSQEMDEQEWDEKAVGGASSFPLFLMLALRDEARFVIVSLRKASD